MRKIFAFGLMALGIMVMLAPTAMAAIDTNVGADTLKFLDQGVIRGNWGTIVGLLIALFGLYMWLVKQETWGIMIILGGVMVTFFPGIFDTLDGGLRAIWGSFGGTGNAITDGGQDATTK